MIDDEWKGNYYRYLITDLLLKMPDGLNTYSLYDDLKSFDQSKDTKKKMIDLFRKNVHYKEIKSVYALKKEGNIGNNYVFEQVKALDKPIIPGSTIKGAIENAIIYCFIFNLKKMKKLVLFFAVAFAMSFASCGNKAAESTEATDSVAVVEEVAVEVVDTVAADSVAVDSAAVAE